MATLNTKPNLPQVDDFYAKLINAHDGLSDDASMALNARIILLMANHIGDQEVLEQVLTAAKLD